MYFGSDSLDQVECHVKSEHPSFARRQPLCELNGNSKRKLPAENLKSAYVDKEVKRQLDDEGTPLLTSNEEGDLMCSVCFQLFKPRDFSRYKQNVQRHLTLCAKYKKVHLGSVF